MVGGDARKRGLFQPGPLRRRLKIEHGILLGEPPEWGLSSYRSTIRKLSRIEITGLGISGPADELFVWPRAQPNDRTRQADFEEENPNLAPRGDATHPDPRTFPSEGSGKERGK